MLSWIVWFLEVFGYVWSLGAIALAGFIWFGAFSLPGWIRATTQQLAVGLLVFAACTYVMRTTYSDGIKAERASWEAKLKAENERRDNELLALQREFQPTMDELYAERAKTKAQTDEIKYLSHHHDHEHGLSADGLQRLRAIGRGR